MKIFIVTISAWDDYSILKVFNSREKAENYAKSLKYKVDISIDEYEVE